MLADESGENERESVGRFWGELGVFWLGKRRREDENERGIVYNFGDFYIYM